MYKPRSPSRFPVFMVCAVVAFVLMVWMGPCLGTTRLNFPNIHNSGAKVVAAIESYQRHRGELPPDLRALVPDYLPRLEKVAYARDKAYYYPHKLFDHDIKSPWAYKVSYDKTSFALAVEGKPTMFYDGQSSMWRSSDDGFADYENPPATVRQKF